jgi:polar amino acid transport system substrate-binding protein
MKKLFSVLGIFVLISILLAACAPTATSSQAPAQTPVATIDPTLLSQKNRLLICSDLPYPPMELFDENGNPTGSDIEIGMEIAKRLGLQGQVVNSVFDTIFAAVTSGKCDIILSDTNITPDRQKQVSMILYFQAGQSMVAAKGNPKNINTPTDLCGLSVAAESGTTESDYLQGQGNDAGKGLPADCAAAGKQPPTVVLTQKDTDALQQLQAGKVVVYFADSPVAGYYITQHPDQFQLVGQVIEPAPVGIGVPCGAADCTNAPLSPVGQAVETALKSMQADGTYAKILAKYNLQGGAVTTP